MVEPAPHRAESNRPLVLALGSGILVALAMPPLPLGVLAPLGIAGWLYSLQLTSHPFRSGVAFGIGFAAPVLFWISWVTVPGTIALVLISAAEYGLLGVTHARLSARTSPARALLFFPALWVVLEYLRALGFIGFPWLNLAHTQTEYLWVIQMVEFTGDYGLALWVVALGAWAYAVGRFRTGRIYAGALLWALVPVAWGAWRISRLPAATDSVRVAILQGDIDTYRKWDRDYIDSSFFVYDSMTRAQAPAVDLVIWPETAAPAYLRQDPGPRRWAEGLAAEVDRPILIGTLSYRRTEERDYIYNSAYLLQPDGRWEGPYSKRRLVPFGEMIPGSQWIPWLADLDLGQGNFQPGPGPVVFHRNDAPLSVLICYESAFSSAAREQVLQGARMLVIITNDSWYGRTPGPAQHAAMASLRAVEFRAGVARAANGGISLWTDRAGRRHQATNLFERTAITADIPLALALTFYARVGPWPVWLAAMVSVPGIWLAWRRKRRT